MSDAEQHRLAGNEHFKAGRFEQAIASYSVAIDAEPSASLFCNRAFANIKLCFSGEAIADADRALEIDPGFAKARYRKASAFLQLGKVKEALAEYRAVSQMVPDDADAKQKLKECEKVYREIQFAKAIASSDTEPMYVKFAKRDIAIPSSYDGPRIGPDNKITPDFVAAMSAYFRDQKLISQRDVVTILLQAIDVLKAQPNVTSIDVPEGEEITVCGDTHGQFYDTLNIFELNGVPSATNRYLFNGDFVDRGSYSVENVVTLLAYKVAYPEHVFLARGNHESIGLNRMYGFDGEVRDKYNDDVFLLFQDVFNCLPLAHMINREVFVTHGGLFSKDGVTIADIQKVDRFRDIPDDGLMTEMLWSDPQVMPGRAKSKRGVGVAFGADVTEDFLRTNGLKLVIRSHEVSDEGHQTFHNGKLITVFSAPNYCDQIGNKGAFIRLRGGDMTPKITTFSHVKHPGKRAMAYSRMMGGMGM
uniref:protein-serine/threonine phosphatase n=1 Tax=Neobodo designis TaxID=312471 RepID=A0A7S1M9H9_NEODS|mmetsp:Transcript_36667/g.112991  ORF Transcript_36667/g.112991 Transcript_36667/m.112991 type:complete len:474 (+) Transcript_36667:34-1455(+)